MPAKLERHAQQLAALGNPLRLSILRRVVRAGTEGTAVGELQSQLDVPWSTLSHHLDRLASAGLLQVRSQGKYVFYSAHYRTLRQLTDYLWQDCCKAGAKGAC
jgi:DNA-binding transcriptional ArsR family regulator